jgi:hypothetical protein
MIWFPESTGFGKSLCIDIAGDIRSSKGRRTRKGGSYGMRNMERGYLPAVFQKNGKNRR